MAFAVTQDIHMASEECADMDLQDIFQHSAGLQTARLIVKSLLSATPNPDGTPLQFPDIDDLSSESAEILRDLLAFKDTEVQEEDNTDATFSRGSDQTSQGKRSFLCLLPASQVCCTDRSSATVQIATPNAIYQNQMVAGDFFSNSRTSGSQHGLPFKAYNVLPNTSAMGPSQSRLGTDSPYRVESPFRPETGVTNQLSAACALLSNQTRPGTDSPYRVESPFRTESDSTLNASSSTLHSPSGTLGHDSNRYNIDRPLHSSIVTAAHSDNLNSVEKHTPNHMAVSTCPPGRSNHKNTSIASNRRASKESSSIKSFLPVNKGAEHIVNNRKEQPTSTANRRIMPNPSAPLSVLAPKVSTISIPSTNSGNDRDGNTDSTAPEITTSKGSKKRKSKQDSEKSTEKKKRKVTEKKPTKAGEKTDDKTGEKTKRVPKPKVPKTKLIKAEPARYRIGLDVWMRILEFTPPAFIRKARLLSKDFNQLVDTYQSIYLNQRLENFGPDMPGPSMHITEKMYNDLLSGKGCMEPGCDDSKASRTHWSWELRLCQNCWKSKIEREDRLQKVWQGQLTRVVINKLLECIPVAMHDSFMKPHDYIEDIDARPRGAPRLYRYHFRSDVDKIVAEHETLKPPPFQENPEHSTAEKATALAAYQAVEAELLTKRNAFLEARKAKNDEHMKRVVMIETCIRNRRNEVAKPYDANRTARKERFTNGALADLPHIPLEFVKHTKAYKAAVRIFRDPGTERGWQLLKPKIQDEWEQSEKRIAERKAIEGSAASTRESSVVNETDRSSYADLSISYPDNMYARNDSPRNISVQQLNHRQHILSQMSPWERATLLPRRNDDDQTASTYFSGLDQMQRYQNNFAPVSFMRPTMPSHQSLHNNAMAMSGSSLQGSNNYVSYRSLSNFSLGNTSAHGSNMQMTDMSQGHTSHGQFGGTNNQLQGSNGLGQGSVKPMAITSLLNSSYSAAPQAYAPWS